MRYTDHWCVKRVTATKDKINEYFNKLCDTQGFVGKYGYVHDPEISEKNRIRKDVYPGYEEISYEDFIKYIVNKEVLYEIF